MRVPDGQMSPEERVMLYDSVFRRKPEIAIEVGTWCGGGSTLQIVSALEHIGRGRLFTCEIDKGFFAQAHQFYSKQYIGYCVTKNIPACELIQYMVETVGPPEFIFFDGSEVPQDALNDFVMLDRHVKSGTVFMMHDWLTPKSTKADLLKPYLNSLETWRITNLLGPPTSVGLVEAVKL